ncbi:hypothetical protein STEG23_032290 [Scotinomys teguina]
MLKLEYYNSQNRYYRIPCLFPSGVYVGIYEVHSRDWDGQCLYPRVSLEMDDLSRVILDISVSLTSHIQLNPLIPASVYLSNPSTLSTFTATIILYTTGFTTIILYTTGFTTIILYTTGFTTIILYATGFTTISLYATGFTGFVHLNIPSSFLTELHRQVIQEASVQSFLHPPLNILVTHFTIVPFS